MVNLALQYIIIYIYVYIYTMYGKSFILIGLVVHEDDYYANGMNMIKLLQLRRVKMKKTLGDIENYPWVNEARFTVLVNAGYR